MSDSSEQRPLLPISSDLEEEQSDRRSSKLAVWRRQTAQVLESSRLHYSIITLVSHVPIFVFFACLLSCHQDRD